ncbi:MAG: DinB family protein [Pseudomonadota bacterium]
MNEIARFISLYDQQGLHTMAYLQTLRPADWQAVPLHSDTLFLGSRVNTITIGALARHLISAERNWMQALLQGASDIAPPKPDAELARTPDGEPLIAAYRAAHQARLQDLAALREADLDRQLRFAGRRYTAMGLLWALYSHHAYHLGQIDLLMRQQGLLAPEYMEWPETERVIA